MKIIVTDEDIVKGRSKNCTECPVALAIKRYTKKFVAVYKNMIYIGNTKISAQIYDTPSSVSKFLSKFDRNKPVKSFEFELKI